MGSLPRTAVRLSRYLQRWTALARPLPSFLVLGAMKGGTTTLFRALAQHPGVATGPKEIGYFSLPDPPSLTWYRNHFPVARLTRRRTVAGEATPFYLFHPHAAGRIAAALPDVRLVALLRNPVERAYSHYRFNCRFGLEPLTFDEALAREDDRCRRQRDDVLLDPSAPCEDYRTYSYTARGLYADQLAVYLRHFPAGQLLVVASEDYFADRAAALGRVFAHIGLGSTVPAAVTVPGPVAPKVVPAAAAERLQAYFAPHNRRLYDLLGRDFGWDRPPERAAA